jgi:hypothetical protein
MERGKCHECGEEVGGERHRHVATSAVADELNAQLGHSGVVVDDEFVARF